MRRVVLPGIASCPIEVVAVKGTGAVEKVVVVHVDVTVSPAGSPTPTATPE